MSRKPYPAPEVMRQAIACAQRDVAARLLDLPGSVHSQVTMLPMPAPAEVCRCGHGVQEHNFERKTTHPCYRSDCPCIEWELAFREHFMRASFRVTVQTQPYERKP